MKKNNFNTTSMYQHEYDETYEHHENHYERIDNNELSFFYWYADKQKTLSEDPLRHHLLRESYYKTLHYSIYCSSTGTELTESQKILHCTKLFGQFLTIYR